MSPILKILTHILTLYMIPLISSDSSQHWITGPPRIPKPETRLSYPLITDEEKIYTCLEKTILVFNNNGSIINRIPLNHTCNPGMTPVLGASRKIYMIAENRVLKINTMKIRANESAWEVFLGPETGVQGLNKIIGLAVSISSSYVIVAIERRGLFGYRYDGRLKWSIGPAVNPTGYRQGCRRGFIGCFFISVPVIDLCDANIYVANNQGEVYSVSIRTRRFKWIQDLSWLDRNFTITAGNNGLLYATVPERSIIVALDVLTGSVKWQKVIGPLSTQDSAPVADNRGWISMGSLDGFLYSISPSGVVRKFFHRKNLDTVVQQAVLDCSGYAVYMSQTKFDRKISRANDENTYVSAMTPLKTVVTLLVPSTGSVIWFESYPSGSVVSSLFPDSDLRRFVVDERMLLAFLSISNTGNRLSCFSTRQKLASSCSLMDIKKVSIYTALVQFCCVFWRKKKLRNQNLRNFLEKRSSLRLQKKVCDRTITELEKKTAEGSSTNEMLEKLGDLVKEREVITRKLSTTYSLGRDATSPKSLSLIPLSDDKKTKSFSPKSGQKESATIFHTISDASSEDYSSIDEKTESKGKALMEPESASDGDDDGEHEAIVEAQGVKIDDEGDDLQTGGTSMRKRSISLTRNVGSST
ncbi:putative quinoprotein alcohol dehydrogenase-like superfamily [Helianthus annuus]|nr:putative quinoprotein alcohol dehydrogenase-like superfamily [Helianthus annuus]KAJ0486322.1 putative quinoprotein alcohol dehydrogenase-like superfamily [Helianthus annuus]KAJ0656874.1 putative quinoprotein alcohol dehydrogenase-like superfamily [Helianthus annuus]